MSKIKPEQVPEAVWQQASGLWFNGATWPQIIAAALSAWPGVLTPFIGTEYFERIILPLPTAPEHERPRADHGAD